MLKKSCNKQAQCVDGDDGKKKRRSGGCGSERFTMWPKFYIFEVAFDFSLKFRQSEKTNIFVAFLKQLNINQNFHETYSEPSQSMKAAKVWKNRKHLVKS